MDNSQTCKRSRSVVPVFDRVLFQRDAGFSVHAGNEEFSQWGGWRLWGDSALQSYWELPSTHCTQTSAFILK